MWPTFSRPGGPPTGATGITPTGSSTTINTRCCSNPPPQDVQQLYLQSLKALGIDPLEHDIRFVEDDWESPTLGASGLGWEVWLDGMEITQFTYFQQAGSIELSPCRWN